MRTLPFVLLAAFLTACLPGPRPQTLYNWTYTDLLALDPVDSTRPDSDLIAVYLRENGQEVQIRLDFLDLGLTPAYDLFLALDLTPGGTRALPLDKTATLEWDALVAIPAAGGPAVLDPDLQPRLDLIPRVVRDPGLDMVVISLGQHALGTDDRTLQVEIFLTRAGERILADWIDVLGSSSPRPGRAPVLLGFWNTFPAYTPAQALRRWDGAHTGPYGERHGLSQLLDAVATYKVPVTLLDLKNPLSLSALDFLGRLPEIRSLAIEELVTLPDVIPLPHQAASGSLPFVPPAEVLARGAAASRAASVAFDLPLNPHLYAPMLTPDLPGTYTAVFLPLSGSENAGGAPVLSLGNWEGRAAIPLPAAVDPLQATADGPALPIRRALLELALTAGIQRPRELGSFVFLGGDLTAGAWGDPQASRAALRYIAGHPWIWPVSGDDLLAARPEQPVAPPSVISPPAAIPQTLDGSPVSTDQTVDQIQMEILETLESPLSRTARDLAWDAYFALLAPNPPFGEELAALRRGYLGQLGGILAAARWYADPQPLTDCTSDVDFDGQPECLLADEQLFTIFEPEGARMTFGFVRTPQGPAQWSGPLSQFLAGFSDSAEWDPSHGPAGDPGDVPGAFTDTRSRWAHYSVTELPGSLGFSSSATGLTKTFTLTPAGLDARIQSLGGEPFTVQIPLALQPETRFSPGWGQLYDSSLHPDGISWQVGEEMQVNVSASDAVSFTSFIDSASYLAGPEDPNFDYPPGHFMPFPLAIVEVAADGEGDLQIRVEIEQELPEPFY